MMAKKQTEGTPEINAISIVYNALNGLDPAAQLRVLRYSADMLGLALELGGSASRASSGESQAGDLAINSSTAIVSDAQSSEDAEGINSVALKWMRRSSLSPKALQPFFSLGIDEIDLVAKSIPGSSKRERMRSVLLLKGIAAYLGTGAARVTYEQLKEAALHYDAYDAANFAANIKSFAADVGGTKEAGFTLTARGLTSATELLRDMMGTKA